MRKFSILIMMIIPLAFFACDEEEITVEYPCLEGEVIGKIRTGGGGLAVALSSSIDGSVIWKDRDDVIEVINIPVEFTVEGTKIFFTARKAHEGEQGPITADGEETIQLILYGKQFTDKGCADLD